MLRPFYYYAKLNDNDVCVEIVSSVYKYPKDIKGYVELPEYNETVRYKKWLGDQWSTETYEPEIDTVIQEKIEQLEVENSQLKDEVSTLNNTITGLNQNISLLENSIMELTALLASLSGGVE